MCDAGVHRFVLFITIPCNMGSVGGGGAGPYQFWILSILSPLHTPRRSWGHPADRPNFCAG